MTLPEIAEAMNALFRKYGLDHDVVAVKALTGTIRLDPRENEPDPMKWRPTPTTTAVPEIVFIRGHDEAQMELLLTTLDFVFQGYFETHPPSDQLRLF
jgi:hypothetical protein